MRIAKPIVSAQTAALTPLEADLAVLLADILLADIERERLEREGKPTAGDITN
jgi:hypothetical protein